MSSQRERRESLLSALRQIVRTAQEQGLDKLASERRLADELEISRGLLRTLLATLAEEGLIRPRKQSGWLLTGQTISEPNNALIGFSEMGRLYGYRTHSEVLESVVRLGYEDELHRLRLPEMSRVWVLRRLRSLDDRPVSVEQVLLPLMAVGTLHQRDMTDRSLLTDLAEIGVVVTRTDVTIEAQAASATVAPFLNLERGAPVLTQREVAYDQYGREIFLGHADYRADSYHFRSTLTRRSR